MMSFANIVIGPIIIALIFGFIIGTRLHLKEENSFKFTAGAIVALIVGGFIMAYDIGQFAYYQDLPIATTCYNWRFDWQCIIRRTSERRSLGNGIYFN